MVVSEELFERAKEIIPGGVNSPVRAFKSVNRTPFFVKKAEGPYIYDVDNNKYIDYVCSWGPAILGHAHPQVIEAVQKACIDGLTYGAPTEKEIQLAELVKKCVPSIDMIRLVSSGTEAVMSAIRVARGYTGREKIIKFVGCYHGHSDGLLIKSGSGLLTESIPNSAGVPKDYAKYTLLAEYNNLDSVTKLFEEYSDEIACIVVEPVAANMGVIPPKPDFLKGLRDTCNKYNSLLIFDEVITGFRLALGGAQEYYGIKADIVTYGKIIGGGMPLAAYAGRKDIMSCVAPCGNVYQAGTLSGNPIAVTAGIETLKTLMNNKEIYTNLDKKAKELELALKKSGFNVNRVESLMTPFFSEGNVLSYSDVIKCDTNSYAKYFSYMLDNGIYIAPSQFESMFVSNAHSNEIIEQTIDTISKYEK